MLRCSTCDRKLCAGNKAQSAKGIAGTLDTTAADIDLRYLEVRSPEADTGSTPVGSKAASLRLVTSKGWWEAAVTVLKQRAEVQAVSKERQCSRSCAGICVASKVKFVCRELNRAWFQNQAHICMTVCSACAHVSSPCALAMSDLIASVSDAVIITTSQKGSKHP